MTVSLFDYPPQHVRKHAPHGYAKYDEFKPWLRDEFQFRCVYCLERERWYPNSKASLSVDHVVAQVNDDTRIVEYSNTVYACSRCNSAKRENSLLDPTETSFANHLEVHADGTLHHKTLQGFKIAFKSNLRFRYNSRYVKAPDIIQLNADDTLLY